jgi:hypothetical protein
MEATFVAKYAPNPDNVEHTAVIEEFRAGIREFIEVSRSVDSNGLLSSVLD